MEGKQNITSVARKSLEKLTSSSLTCAEGGGGLICRLDIEIRSEWSERLEGVTMKTDIEYRSITHRSNASSDL